MPGTLLGAEGKQMLTRQGYVAGDTASFLSFCLFFFFLISLLCLSNFCLGISMLGYSSYVRIRSAPRETAVSGMLSDIRTEDRK